MSKVTTEILMAVLNKELPELEWETVACLPGEAAATIDAVRIRVYALDHRSAPGKIDCIWAEVRYAAPPSAYGNYQPFAAARTNGVEDFRQAVLSEIVQLIAYIDTLRDAADKLEQLFAPKEGE